MPSFYEWLLVQTERNDHVGDVARDVRVDRTRLRVSCPHPTTACNHRGIRRHLRDVHAACPDALDAIDRAYAEYRRVSPRRGSQADCFKED